MSISVVVPCFNHGATLQRTIDSVLAQREVHEILIVDDRSTDDSFAQAKRLAQRDERIRVLQMPANGGPGAARNLGAAQACGEFLSFVDADDEVLGDFFAEALALFAREPALQAVKCDVEFFDPVKGYILPDYDPRYAAAVLSSSCGMVLRRACFAAIGGFPEEAVFRGPAGGEDVAFMEALKTHFQPIGRIPARGYRVWSRAGAHTDRFLATTRLKDKSLEFVALHPDQVPGGPLAQALDNYLAVVARRLGGSPVFVNA
jgi:glycosyltransferase involved in cell wall biosynthesis